MSDLQIAKCCGTCIHCNRPRKPDDHAAHYTVSKTQRWCYLHKIRTTRECICGNYEKEDKKGGAPACKRIFKFNERAKRIETFIEAMKNLGVIELSANNTLFTLHNDWLCRKYEFSWSKEPSYWKVRDDESDFDRFEKALWESLNKIKGEIK